MEHWKRLKNSTKEAKENKQIGPSSSAKAEAISGDPYEEA